MKPKVLGIIQLIGAALAFLFVVFKWSLAGLEANAVALILFAILFVVVGIHHVTEPENK